MENKRFGVLVATLALTMILPTGAIASSSTKTPIVASQEVASKELEKIAARTLRYSRSPMRRLACSMR